MSGRRDATEAEAEAVLAELRRVDLTAVGLAHRLGWDHQRVSAALLELEVTRRAVVEVTPPYLWRIVA